MKLCEHNQYSLKEISIPDDAGHVTHYKCIICNSTFPVIGNTDQWEPVAMSTLDWHTATLENSGNMLAHITVKQVLEILDEIASVRW